MDIFNYFFIEKDKKLVKLQLLYFYDSKKETIGINDKIRNLWFLY